MNPSDGTQIHPLILILRDELLARQGAGRCGLASAPGKNGKGNLRIRGQVAKSIMVPGDGFAIRTQIYGGIWRLPWMMEPTWGILHLPSEVHGCDYNF